LDKLLEQSVPFALVFTRVAIFLGIVPVLGPAAPPRLRGGLALAASAIFVALIPHDPGLHTLHWRQLAVMVLAEGVCAVALGLSVYTLFQAARIGARLMERQMGFAFARMVDPISGVQQSIISNLFELCATVVFFAINGHHLFFYMIRKSYASFPLGQIPSISTLASGILESTALSLAMGLQLGAPVMALLFVITVLLGVLARAIPEMNVMMTMFPMRISIGLLGVIAFLPHFSAFIQKIAATLLHVLPA